MINLTCLGKYLTLPDSGRDGGKRESVIWRMSGWEIRGGKGMVREKEEVDRGKWEKMEGETYEKGLRRRKKEELEKREEMEREKEVWKEIAGKRREVEKDERKR